VKQDQVFALIRSHTDGDEERFQNTVRQMAAHAEAQGRYKTKQRLLGATQQSYGVRRLQPLRSLSDGKLFDIVSSTVKMDDLVLSADLRTAIQDILAEQRAAERLAAHNLSPARKLLFVGPPGTGKTASAALLATELGRTCYRVKVDGLIKSHLGETGANVRMVFDHIRDNPGNIYLFDEFDSLGASRASKTDLPEMRRVLNSILMFLEDDPSDNILIGATNLPELLDHALRRRFDQVITYTLPAGVEAWEVAERVWTRHRVIWAASIGYVRDGKLPVELAEKLSAKLEGSSHAEIEQWALRLAKRVVLANGDVITNEDVYGCDDEEKTA